MRQPLGSLMAIADLRNNAISQRVMVLALWLTTFTHCDVALVYHDAEVLERDEFVDEDLDAEQPGDLACVFNLYSHDG